ncbi:MAG: UDP-N-acetylmuramoyl-L-alanine--D-glutamate ligase [Deltaproteobacteria bacterium]|nr:UDP-N-acetylmuramoyl-L-alanine--D-glutamate ligase [Deltaproteobacteria bacterium]
MDLSGKSVLVLGLGISGRSSARFCAARGARVVAADERPLAELAEPGDLMALAREVEVRAGQAFPDPALFDVLVPSPGIPPERYAGRARTVWGDIELTGRCLQVPVIAVTGTNGKSTTVMLIEAMLSAAGLRAKAAGNVGTPALSLVGEPLDVAVLEVSSFQLESTDAFQPRIAVVLNISPDHLDRHGHLDDYAAVKRRLVERQRAGDAAVLCFDDPRVRDFASAAGGEVVPMSTRKPLVDSGTKRAAWLDAGAAVLRDGTQSLRLSLDSLRLPGRHNLENVLAALTAVWLLGVDPERALDALTDFRDLPHRSERVAEIAGVRFVNDSKATNPGAALRAIESAAGPVIWIAGGRDKGLSYEALAEMASTRVRHALLIGEAAPLIEQALHGRVPCEQLESLDAAVETAALRAQPGDVVLLAPACASFDQFQNFEARGECFRDAVARLDVGGSA